MTLKVDTRIYEQDIMTRVLDDLSVKIQRLMVITGMRMLVMIQLIISTQVVW